MGEEGKDEQEQEVPLLTDLSTSPSSSSSDGHFKRTGTYWTAIAHIITAVIGSGVLSLAWSTAQLGWIAGPLAMVTLAAVTMINSTILSDLYRSPDSEYGPIRNRSYIQAVKYFLGNRSVWWCGIIQQTSLYGNAIAYIITSSNSMSTWAFGPAVCTYAGVEITS